MSFEHLSFVFNFKDPATLYAHSLISVHHDVMWYLILALSIIYWALYKILREFNWSFFSKQFGLLRIFYLNTVFLYLEAFCIWVWLVFFSFFSSIFFDFMKKLEYFIFESDINNDHKMFFIMGWEYLTGFNDIPWLNRSSLNFNFVINILKEKYLDYLLFERITTAYYYYDEEFLNVNSFLTVQKFRHSTVFEFVWATFPTTIILMILVPSMLLLYSLDEDLDPKLTIKVIGHQWFWSYEFGNWLEVDENQFGYFSYDFDSCLVVDDYLTLVIKGFLKSICL